MMHQLLANMNLLLCFAGIASCAAFAGPHNLGTNRGPAALSEQSRSDVHEGDAMTRRETLAKALLFGVGAMGALSSPAAAFPNKISNQYDE